MLTIKKLRGNFAKADPQVRLHLGRDGALRHSRRVQRRNRTGRAGALLQSFRPLNAGRSIAARCPGFAVWLLALLLAFVSGCTPPGPRALLEGKELIEQGKYAPAIEKLKLATTLLPTNALAWNYLGLAYHNAGEPANALGSYQKAIKLNHDLVVVHYNLGCLFLEQNKPNLNEAARDELMAFTLHQGNSLDGRLKLATAQLRLGELAPAEASFKEALRISPQSAEAMNGLGMAQIKRNRPRDAIAWFEAALKQQPGYPPALLNLAVVLQSTPNGHAQALQKYQEYLALNPRPANWNAVNTAARQLELELNPPAPAHLTTNAVAAAPPPIATHPATNNPSRVAVNSNNPSKPDGHAFTAERSGQSAVGSPLTSGKATAPSNLTSGPVAPVKPISPSTPTQAAPEVVQLSEPLIVKPADDNIASNAGQPGPSAPAEPIVEPLSSDPAATTPKPVRKGFLQRVNPVNWFNRDTAMAKADPSSPVVVTPDSKARTAEPVNSAAIPQEASAEPISVTNRYVYRSPPKPRAGDRVEAERLFAQALEAQRDRRIPEAVAGYRAATQADPGFFEAQCNLGLSAYDASDMPLSLSAHETALAIRPDSFNARFNFALALKKAGYLIDAAQELERLLVVNANESPAHLASAHLMLANLYAEQFHQPHAARPHYLKVLDLDPKNSQATIIRYWLRDNP
jgi:tetratricopeptide (TPR) repeat protein